MTVAIVQRSPYGNVGSGLNQVTFGGAVANGNTVVISLFIGSYLALPTIITDDKSNTYTKDGDGATTSGGSIDHFAVYRCANVTNAPTVISVTTPGRLTKLIAYEVSGLSGSPLDVTVQIGNSAASATPSYSFTTTASGEFALGILSVNNAGSSTTFTAGSSGIPWHFDSDNTAATVWFESYAPTGAAGNYVLDGSIPSPDGVWDFMVTTYQGASTPLMGAACL